MPCSYDIFGPVGVAMVASCKDPDDRLFPQANRSQTCPDQWGVDDFCTGERHKKEATLKDSQMTPGFKCALITIKRLVASSESTQLEMLRQLLIKEGLRVNIVMRMWELENFFCGLLHKLIAYKLDPNLMKYSAFTKKRTLDAGPIWSSRGLIFFSTVNR